MCTYYPLFTALLDINYSIYLFLNTVNEYNWSVGHLWAGVTYTLFHQQTIIVILLWPKELGDINYFRVFLVLNQLVTPADAWGSRNTYSNERGVYNSGHEYNNPKNLAGNDPGLPSQSAPRRGLGISAWGIVLVVVALILAGMGFYYFSICYDICQPTKSKYDKMGLPTMA